LRKIGKAVGLSKDRVARSLAAIAKRNKYPESHLWETEEGQAWLRIMVIAVLYEFGVKENQGADRISEFFKRIRVNTHVGISTSALRAMMTMIEEQIAEAP
jgi:RNase H-fold protein (predicted Holliday junction resolvase)